MCQEVHTGAVRRPRCVYNQAFCNNLAASPQTNPFRGLGSSVRGRAVLVSPASHHRCSPELGLGLVPVYPAPCAAPALKCHVCLLATTFPPWSPPVPPGHHLSLLGATFSSWMSPFPSGCHLPLLPIPTVTGGDDESTPLTHLVPFPDPAAAKPSLSASRGAQHHPTLHVTSQKNPFGHQPHPVAPRPPHPASSPTYAMLGDEAGRATQVS